MYKDYEFSLLEEKQMDALEQAEHDIFVGNVSALDHLTDIEQFSLLAAIFAIYLDRETPREDRIASVITQIDDAILQAAINCSKERS